MYWKRVPDDRSRNKKMRNFCDCYWWFVYGPPRLANCRQVRPAAMVDTGTQTSSKYEGPVPMKELKVIIVVLYSIL